jgi:uncharacterized protein
MSAMTESAASIEGGPGALFGGGSQVHRVTGERVYHLGRLALDPGAAPAWLDLPFLAHGLTPSPHDEARLVLFEKHGPGACVVDLRRGEVVHTLEAGPGREFYGHGAFSRDGSLLYCTETDVTDGYRGVLAVRDGRDFRLLGELPSYGIAPHDCALWGDGDTLVVCNGGSPVGTDEHAPNVAFVDLSTEALLESVRPSSPRINTGHLAVGRGGELAVVSAPRDGLSPVSDLGGISLRGATGPLRTMDAPREVVGQLRGETLSVAIHEPTRTVAATTPLAHYLTFWHLDTGELLGSLRVPDPRGVAVSLDESAFIVNFGNPPAMARVDPVTRRPIGTAEDRKGTPTFCTGSHILVADLPGWG